MRSCRSQQLIVVADAVMIAIGADVEVIPIAEVNAAYERVLRSDVRYRFVLDLAGLKTAAA